jgi:hypothetical protein
MSSSGRPRARSEMIPGSANTVHWLLIYGRVPAHCEDAAIYRYIPANKGVDR